MKLFVARARAMARARARTRARTSGDCFSDVKL